MHICASPHLDHAAACAIGFRCIWIDRSSGRKPLAHYTPDRTFPSSIGCRHSSPRLAGADRWPDRQDIGPECGAALRWLRAFRIELNQKRFDDGQGWAA